MKIKSALLSFAAILCLGISASAADDHSHAKKIAGPNGGRVLTNSQPSVEFFVTADRKVQITFLDKDGKALAPGGQRVVVTAGDRAAPTKLTFAQSGGVLLSESPLPQGNNFPAVVQIKADPDAKWATEKFNVNLSQCPDCDHAEYACTCAH